jgi:hypothetical protein
MHMLDSPSACPSSVLQTGDHFSQHIPQASLFFSVDQNLEVAEQEQEGDPTG